MFYKLMNGDIVIDILREAQYVRYLPRAKRWMNTDKLSANGILANDGSTIYHILGRACACPTELIKVRIEEIDEQEYNALLSQLSSSRAENQKLQQEINSLRVQLNE